MFCEESNCWQDAQCALHNTDGISTEDVFPWGDPMTDDEDEERARYDAIKKREDLGRAQRPWRLSFAEEIATPSRSFELGRSCSIQYQVCNFTPSSSITFTGRRIWDSALVLCKYMQLESERFSTGHREAQAWLRGKKVLELGAGLALPTLAACAFGASVAVCTDLPHQIPLMEQNISLNEFCMQARAVPLSWGKLGATLLDDLGAPFDLVLCADVLFSDEAITLLVDTLCSVCSPETLVLTSNEHRWQGADGFYSLLRSRGPVFLTISSIPCTEDLISMFIKLGLVKLLPSMLVGPSVQ